MRHCRARAACSCGEGLPAELRALCERLAEGCAHAGQRFEMLPQPYEPYEHLGLGPEAVKAFDEAVAQVAGVEPAMVLPAWAESDYEPSPSYSGSMLGNGLRIGQSNASFAYVAAWAVQNQLMPHLCLKRGWVARIGVDFVKVLLVVARGLFALGPLLDAEVRAREHAGKAQPCKLTVDDVAAAATSAHDILVKASEQLEELVEAERSDSATCPVAGTGARFRDTWTPSLRPTAARRAWSSRRAAPDRRTWRKGCRRAVRILIPACVKACVRHVTRSS